MYKIVSLFSGCGGFDLGFLGGFNFLGKHYHKNDYEVVFANDFDRHACASYRHNIGDIYCGDIGDFIHCIPRDVDVLIGGFPCQPFSLAGQKKALDDARGTLYLKMLEAIKIAQPKVFIAENVKHILSIQDGSVFDRIIDDFESIGYHISYKLYDMSCYGVPQKRERVIIIGSMRNFVHPDLNLTRISCQEAIGDLAHNNECQKTWHIISTHNISESKFKAVNTPLHGHRPACTITCKYQPRHYSLPRRLSARESARLQSFPDSYDWQSPKTYTFKQIGNAVPPVFAWHLAQYVARYLESEKK
jgi:DNA (cytosine-5)-methyltransferase 1